MAGFYFRQIVRNVIRTKWFRLPTGRLSGIRDGGGVWDPTDLQESRFQFDSRRAIISGMWYPSALTPSQKEERRLEGGRLLCEGRLTHAQIAVRLGVTTQAIGQWAKAPGPNAGGLGVLRGRRPTGRPPLLTPEQWEEVLGILAQGALDAGFETERWTLRRIRQVILKQFGVDYHPNYLAERLKASGWTAQVPAVQARERDEELVRAWLQRDWPRIKSSAQGCGDCLRRRDRVLLPVENGEHMGPGRPDPRPATDQQTSRGHHGGWTDAVGTDLQAAFRPRGTRARYGPLPGPPAAQVGRCDDRALGRAERA